MLNGELPPPPLSLPRKVPSNFSYKFLPQMEMYQLTIFPVDRILRGKFLSDSTCPQYILCHFSVLFI